MIKYLYDWNGNLPGMGGVYNLINLHADHRNSGNIITAQYGYILANDGTKINARINHSADVHLESFDCHELTFAVRESKTELRSEFQTAYLHKKPDKFGREQSRPDI
jgi:hypothetical protein